jgi:hypothetical protein
MACHDRAVSDLQRAVHRATKGNGVLGPSFFETLVETVPHGRWRDVLAVAGEDTLRQSVALLLGDLTDEFPREESADRALVDRCVGLLRAIAAELRVRGYYASPVLKRDRY